AFDALTVDPSALGTRLAKNTPIVLAAESHLAAVRDPGNGSYYIEALTDALARAGWAELGRIESEGGLARSLEAGAFQARVTEARRQRGRDIARRKRVLVGTSDFASEALPLPTAGRTRDPAPGALPAARDAEPFEALRASVDAMAARLQKRPSVLLIGLGPAPTYRAREAFVRRLFEVPGFVVDLLPDPGAEAATEEAFLTNVLRARAPGVVCLVGADETYPTTAEPVVAAAKHAGVPAIVLAGKPGSLSEPLTAAGLTHSVALGDDMVAVLESIVAAVGGAS
ncbi:MAG: hypothetical protein JNK04_15835, partial [Myxococcales bacterium]|nr:hypothetical protein [Myxococcales bacterium]